MKLGEGEEKVAEYYFKGVNDVANMSVLTNRRLVVVYGNAEESYPLSKITGVKIIFNRSWWMLIVGVIIALIGLGTLGNSVGGGIVALAIGGGLGYLGWKGKTRMLINQMGGEKYYAVRGKDQKLIEFMDAVNSKLS
jgi:hypothetical protein